MCPQKATTKKALFTLLWLNFYFMHWFWPLAEISIQSLEGKMVFTSSLNRVLSTSPSPIFLMPKWQLFMLPSFQHGHLFSQALARKSQTPSGFQSLVHKESFCFPSSRFQGTQAITQHIRTPPRYPKGYQSPSSWWTFQAGGDWNAASDPSVVMLCKPSLSLYSPCRGLVAASYSRRWPWLSDSQPLAPSQLREGRPTRSPLPGMLTLPLRSPASHLTPLSTSLQARARTPCGSVLPLTICCFWADYLVIRLLQIKTVAFQTTVSALSFKNS